MINIAVLDDELEIISQYEKQIPFLMQKNNVEGNLIIATNLPSKFLDIVKSRIVNVCIIDINLRTNVTGMHIANQIRQEGYPCEILFMTGHLEYIQQAFEVQAYNFIQKPGWEALEKNIVKISNELIKHQQRKTLCIKCGSEVFFIIHDDICYIEHIGAKTIVCTNNGQYQTYEGLEDLIQRINDNRFIRFHRSVFVNVSYIEKIDIKSKELKLTNGFQFKIGPKYYSNLKTQDGWEKLLCF